MKNLSINKMTKSKLISKLALLGILGLAIFGGIKGCTKINQISKEEKINYNHTTSLINQGRNKATGEDYVLDFAEGIELAKQLGYEGQISPGEHIKLTQCGNHAHLWFGRKMDHTPIYSSQLENYLNSSETILSKEEKYALNSKYGYGNQTEPNKEYNNVGVGVRFDPLTGEPSMGLDLGMGIYDLKTGKIKIGPTIGF